MEKLKEDCMGHSGVDEEYEFDAPQFYDFTGEEFESQVKEIESWFEVSGDYPPSPFILKLNSEIVQPAEDVPSSSEAKCSNNRTKSINSSSSNSGRSPRLSTSKKDAKGKKHSVPDNPKPKWDDKLSMSRSSSFMKPTASHLAKQKKVHENNSSHLCKRSSFQFK